jgi:glucose-1-phosphate thymidylyltransferase
MKNYSRAGVVLAGGLGMRLYPLTKYISKHLLPIYDKPMIYYPISILMLLGIKDILIIVKSEDLDSFNKILGNGSHLGISISYKIQEKPNGIAESLIISEDFVRSRKICLILGDNIFYGSRLISKLKKAYEANTNTIVAYTVQNPKNYGVVQLDQNGIIKDISEKPKNPKSNLAVTGLYFYQNEVINYAKLLKPSKRNELEITDVNKILLKKKKLKCITLDRGNAWLDAGSVDSYMEASLLISIVEKRQGLNIGSIEEVSFFNGWITKKELKKIINESRGVSSYYQYLSRLL